jgi:4-hydroxyphenylpyruvate dioxygenase
VIAFEVADAADAYKETTLRGAVGVIPPTETEDRYGIFHYSAIQGYGDVILKFIDRSDYQGAFAPGFQPCSTLSSPTGFGLKQIDHVVANVELGAMDKWVNFFKDCLGFSVLMHFDDQAISTQYSALMSKVMQDPTGKIKLPINEPAPGQCKSQIQEYLEFNQGPGIQHIALATDNIVKTVTELRRAGAQFLQVPRSYYDRLKDRIGEIHQPIDQLAELGILVDRDQEGYLLQIFTQPLQDRPTLFFEIIERHGSEGFGEGNFKALFESIEREQALRGNL